MLLALEAWSTMYNPHPNVVHSMKDKAPHQVPFDCVSAGIEGAKHLRDSDTYPKDE